MYCFLFFNILNMKKEGACCVCSVAMFLIPPVFTMELFGKPPHWADGVCREEREAGTWALYAAHAHFPFPAQAFVKGTSVVYREFNHQSVLGNTAHVCLLQSCSWIHAAATVKDMDSGESFSANQRTGSCLPPSLGMISITLIIVISIKWMWCVHYMNPLPTEWNV